MEETQNSTEFFAINIQNKRVKTTKIIAHFFPFPQTLIHNTYPGTLSFHPWVLRKKATAHRFILLLKVVPVAHAKNKFL